MKFNDYMPDGGEYVNPTTIHGYGWRIDYVSSTFLEGWINYVKPIRTFAVSRYTSPDDLRAKVAEFHAPRQGHTSISAIGDDVLMLCAEEAGGYWFFWWDRDVSDCCIGRFRAEHTEADVVASFDTYVNEVAADEVWTMFPLDAAKFTGWISW